MKVMDHSKEACEKGRVRIYIASHKLVPFPQNPAYQPIIIGPLSHVVPPTVVTDATGENISIKNPSYCELTALYWAWKNDTLKDYIGLVHYRRYFRTMHPQEPLTLDSVLQEEEILDILKDHDIIVPEPFKSLHHTMGEFYRLNHCPEDLEAARRIIGQCHPDYLEAFDAIMERQGIYGCNMFITRREVFCDYMQWLFDILFRVEKEVGGFMHREPYQRRAPGFLAERLMNVYILRHHFRTKVIPFLLTDL